MVVGEQFRSRALAAPLGDAVRGTAPAAVPARAQPRPAAARRRGDDQVRCQVQIVDYFSLFFFVECKIRKYTGFFLGGAN